MPEGYVEIEGVCYDGTFPSGKAIRVIANSHFYSIPVSAIHEDSEIFPGTTHVSGKLIVRESLAVEKGLVENEPEGSGIILKKLPRSRLKPPEGLLSVRQLKKISLRAKSLSSRWLERAGTEVYRHDELVAVFDGPKADLEAEFYANAASDMHRLLAEVKVLRGFVAKVIGK